MSGRPRTWSWAIFLLALLAAGCGRASNPDEPPDIAYGEDVCERCQMIVSDKRYAAAYWTPDGRARRFDDIGGMLAYHFESAEEVAAYWVHDFSGGQWLRAEEAVYVIDAGLSTPMGFDLVAFADGSAAEALAYGSDEALVLDFSTLMAQVADGELVLDPRHRHDNAAQGDEHDGAGEQD